MTRKIYTIVLIIGLFYLTGVIPVSGQLDEISGKWQAELDTGHGKLPFGLEIEEGEQGFQAFIVNGHEKIPATLTEVDQKFKIEFKHYDSRIVFEKTSEENNRETDSILRGTWYKTRGTDYVTEVPFLARKSSAEIEMEDPAQFLGRFEVEFEGDDQTAVAIFKRDQSSKRVLGTFLTTTGDYRFLAGHVEGGELTLSCFDGAHAFLFKAKVSAKSELTGQFYSGNWYSQNWKARLNSEAKLPDATKLTTLVSEVQLGEMSFPDLKGDLVKLNSIAEDGQVSIIEVFGTWCPNCHDAAEYLTELDKKYGDKLTIMGLAFEITDDFERNVEQVQTYKEKFSIQYPILIAGPSDKSEATETLKLLDKIRSYPTFLFLDNKGNVVKIYQGFSGPATGNAHQELRKTFEETISGMLDQPGKD